MTELPEDELNKLNTAYRQLVEEMRRNMERQELEILFGIVAEDPTRRAAFNDMQFTPTKPPVEPPRCPNGQHDWGEYQEREEWTVNQRGSGPHTSDQLVRSMVLVSTCLRCGVQASLDL